MTTAISASKLRHNDSVKPDIKPRNRCGSTWYRQRQRWLTPNININRKPPLWRGFVAGTSCLMP